MAISARDFLWFAAGLLTALAAGFVLAPLMPSAQSLRARLSVATWPLLAGSLALALALYIWRGSPDPPATVAIAGVNAAVTGGAPTSKSSTQVTGSMETMLARLQQRLANQGGSPADWELLAQTYDFLGRKADAANARTRHQVAISPAVSSDLSAIAVAAMLPDATSSATIVGTASNTSAQIKQLLSRADSARRARDYDAAVAAYQQLLAGGGMTAQSWADYADVTASRSGDGLSGAAERDVDTALALDPHNEKALWLKASAYHENKRYTEAIATWQQLLQLTPGASADSRVFAANLTEDQALAAGRSSRGVTGGVAAISTAASTPALVQVSGEVALADALRNQVPSGLTLFIVAKSLESPGPPVAVVRTQTSQWPMRFVLDDSLAMLSSRPLSKAGRISVEARISHAGTAAAQAGDFQSATATVDPREHKAVRLVIDRVIG